MKKKLRSLVTVAVSRLVRFSSFLRNWWSGLAWIDFAGCIMLLSIGLNCWAGILQRRNLDRLRDEALNNRNTRSNERGDRKHHEPLLSLPVSDVELSKMPNHLLVVDDESLNNVQSVGGGSGPSDAESIQEAGQHLGINGPQLPVMDQVR